MKDNSPEAKPAVSSNEIAKKSDQMGKRRLSVFNNVYLQCRIENKNGKEFCLYLANLYHNLKGFHGI